VDDFGLGVHKGGLGPISDKVSREEEDEAMDPTPWLRMLFGVLDADTQEAAKRAFKGTVKDKVRVALRRCRFPRGPGCVVPPDVVAAKSAYAPGPLSDASEFVFNELSKRPYIFESLVSAFAVVWDEEILRIGDTLRAKAVHSNIVSTVKVQFCFWFCFFLMLQHSI
jgi:hypothetical protein